MSLQQQEDLQSQMERFEVAKHQTASELDRLIGELHATGEESKAKEDKMYLMRLEICSMMHDLLPGDLYVTFSAVCKSLLDIATIRLQEDRKVERRRLADQIQAHQLQLDVIHNSIRQCKDTLHTNSLS